MQPLSFPISKYRDTWPSLIEWLSIAHDDAINLFPKEVYFEYRAIKSILGKKIIVSSLPDEISYICGSGRKNYKLANLHLRMLKPALGSGLVVAEGSHWILQRRLAFNLMPKNHEDYIQSFINERIDLTIKHWVGRAVSSKDLIDDLVALSIDLIAISVFKHCESVAHEGILQSINAHRKNIEKMDFMDALGLPEWLYSPRMLRARSIGHAIDREINETVQYAASKTSLGRVSHPDVTLTRDFVLSLVTGFESVATATLWMLTILSQDNDLQRRITAENNSFINVSRKLPLNGSILDCVTLETLRLFPPLPFIFRQAVKDNNTPGGFIKKGDLVCFSPWIIHRHKKHWENPDDFEWQKFSNITKLPDAYMPFGVGSRQCVGMGVGFNLVKQIVHRTISQSEVALKEGDRFPAPRAGVSLRPKSEYHLQFDVKP